MPFDALALVLADFVVELIIEGGIDLQRYTGRRTSAMLLHCSLELTQVRPHRPLCLFPERAFFKKNELIPDICIPL